MKIKVWCDSGANIYSAREEVIDIKSWGFSDEDWNEMTEDEKYKEVELWAWDRLEIGYKELEPEDE